jgi:hypothetical protein
VPAHHRHRFDDGDRIQNPREESVQPRQQRSVFCGLARCWDLRLRTITCCRSTRISASCLARVFKQ